MRRLFIDTDTGSDDAVALVMALRTAGVRVEGISTVAGNVDLSQATRNALTTVELCGAAVPVYAGVAAPLLRPHRDARDVHGPDGLGGMNYPAPSRRPESRHGVDALTETIMAMPGELTLVTLGPLTNVAVALTRTPELAGAVREIVMMGGAHTRVGNVDTSPSAEYNIWGDPEAARIVFRSGAPITMVGIELCRGEAVVNADDQRRIRAIGTPYANFVLDINGFLQQAVARYGIQGIDMPDPVAMAVAIDRAVLLEEGRYYVDIETTGELTLGETVVDFYGVTGRVPNASVGLRLDAARFKSMLESALR
ncbi:MAG TPA: nucleoside hydrolase [Chloroflexota bacterium]|nr:nucleoside hydrolase [Chloroflexota bacterium]